MRINIKRHARILLNGFARTIGGTAAAGLLGASVYGFASIPTEGGYAAVADFAVAIILLLFALLTMYCLGAANGKRKNRKPIEPKRGLFLAK